MYAFLRKHDDELLLIVANFDEHATEVDVHIPIHAFDYFHLPTLEGVEAVELLTGTTTTLSLTPDAPVRLTVPGYSGGVWKVRQPLAAVNRTEGAG